MKRINIYIKEETDKELDYLSEMLNKSKSELFRSAVHEYRNRYHEQLQEFVEGLEDDKTEPKELYSTEELQLLAKSASFSYFLNNVAAIKTLDNGITKFNAYAFQHDLLIDLDIRKYLIINHSRQIGMSTILQLYALHKMLYNTSYAITWCSISQKMANAALANIKDMYELLPECFKKGNRIVNSNKGTIYLENGANINTTSFNASSTMRGRSINTIILDEFSFAKSNIAKEFMDSTFPVIASGTKPQIIINSVPNGFNHFYKLCTDARSNHNNFYYMEYPYFVIPNRDNQWVKQTISQLGLKAFLSEFMCEFIPVDASEDFMQKYIHMMQEDITNGV
jgi:predicted transcriptional regulator